MNNLPVNSVGGAARGEISPKRRFESGLTVHQRDTLHAKLRKLDAEIFKIDKILAFRRWLYQPSDPTARALSARRRLFDERRRRVRLTLKGVFKDS